MIPLWSVWPYAETGSIVYYGLHQLCHLFLCGSQAKYGFIFLKSWVFENYVKFLCHEVLLEYSHSCLFLHCLWLLVHHSGRVELS
jgi:hypothetical protein